MTELRQDLDDLVNDARDPKESWLMSTPWRRFVVAIASTVVWTGCGTSPPGAGVTNGNSESDNAASRQPGGQNDGK